MKTVWRVFGYFKRYPWMAAGTMSCAILGTLMVIVFPGVTKWIIDDVVRQHHPEKLMPLVLFALVALIPFPLLIAGALTYTLTAHRRYRLQRRAASAMNALLHDNLSGIRQIKSFAREKEEHARFNRVSDQLRYATLVVMRVWAIYSPLMSMFEAIGAVIVLAFGSYAVVNGTMQIGDLVAFLMLTAFLYDPISRLHQLNQLVQAGRAAGERVFEILDEPIEPGWIDHYAPVRVAGDIRYESVNFGYAEGLPALKNISLHAQPGETIALVGATGAGKSTLASLLPRDRKSTR